MDKQEKETKKDISKRLKFSDKNLWDSLSSEQRNTIVDEYYHSRDIEKIGLAGVLENNRQIRKDIGLMFLGISFGLFSSIFINVVSKYFPQNNWAFDLLISIGFIIIIYFTIKEFEKLSYEDLGANNVLKYLINQVEEKNIKKAKLNQKL